MSGTKQSSTNSSAPASSSSDCATKHGGIVQRLRTSPPRNNNTTARTERLSPDPVPQSERSTPTRSSGHSQQRDHLAKWTSSLERLGYETDIDARHTPRLSPTPSRKRSLVTTNSQAQTQAQTQASTLERTRTACALDVEPSVTANKKDTISSRRSTTRRSTTGTGFRGESDSSADALVTGTTPRHQLLISKDQEHFETLDRAVRVRTDSPKPRSSLEKTTQQARHSHESSPKQSSDKPIVPTRLKKAPPTKTIQFTRPSLNKDDAHHKVNAVKGATDDSTGAMLSHDNNNDDDASQQPFTSRSRSRRPFKARSHGSTAESHFVFGQPVPVDTSAESSIESELDEPREVLAQSPTSGPRTTTAGRSTVTSPATTGTGRKLGRSHESLGLVMSGHRPKPGDADYQKRLRINDDDGTGTSRRALMTPGQLRHCMDRINIEAVKAAKQHVEYIRMNGGDPSWSLVSAERIARKIKIHVCRVARTTPLPTSIYKTPMFRDRAHAAEMKRQWQAKIEKSKANLEKLDAQHDVLRREVDAQTRRSRELEQRYRDELAQAVQPHPMHNALLNRFKPRSNPGHVVTVQQPPSSASKRKSKQLSKTEGKLPAQLFTDAPKGTLHQFLEAWTRDEQHER